MVADGVELSAVEACNVVGACEIQEVDEFVLGDGVPVQGVEIASPEDGFDWAAADGEGGC